MYITQLDELFDETINNLYNFLIQKKAFDSFKKDENFVSIQNYIKAGNLIQASLNLKEYKNTFEKDLIYPDGSSFIENIETILNHSAPTISGKFALTNNNRVIRSELKRINYWSKN